MAKIVLHIGVPKTATTTLQNWFFYALHQKGMINYLGRLSSDVVNKNNIQQQFSGDNLPNIILRSKYDSQKLNKYKQALNAVTR